MKILPKIAKEQNIPVSTILGYCIRLGHYRMNLNSLITPIIERQIIDLHKAKDQKQKQISKEDVKVPSTSDLPIDFHVLNPFHHQGMEIIAENDIFSNRAKRTIKFQDIEIETVFNDFEANSICLGLDNKHAKHLARNYFKTNFQHNSEKFEVHKIAMAT